MATPSPYGPFADRKSVTKTAKKMCNDFESDAFVVEVAPWKFQAFSADFPGDQPAGNIVETFRWTRPKHYDCEHENCSPTVWNFYTGAVKTMRCNDCGEVNHVD